MPPKTTALLHFYFAEQISSCPCENRFVGVVLLYYM